MKIIRSIKDKGKKVAILFIEIVYFRAILYI